MANVSIVVTQFQVKKSTEYGFTLIKEDLTHEKKKMYFICNMHFLFHTNMLLTSILVAAEP